MATTNYLKPLLFLDTIIIITYKQGSCYKLKLQKTVGKQSKTVQFSKTCTTLH